MVPCFLGLFPHFLIVDEIDSCGSKKIHFLRAVSWRIIFFHGRVTLRYIEVTKAWPKNGYINLGV